MKKVNVIVRDRNTLVLEESAEKGDYIDLSSLSVVDESLIDNLIKEGKDRVYEQKLNEVKNHLSLQNKNELENLKLSLKNEYQEKINALNSKIETFELNKKNEISFLTQSKNGEIERLKQSKDFEIERIKLELAQNYQNQITVLKEQLHNKDLLLESSLVKKELELKEEYQNLLNQKDRLLKEKEDAYNLLSRQKSTVNVKNIGEDLEHWCSNLMNSYMQNGFLNCTWEKDNTVIRNDDEKKGSKADFIFKVFASEAHKENELLTSVCLEMKDENPDSVNKKKNSDYFKALDSNRNKKKCKYAILVSQLEADQPNQDVIQRVLEYPDMYVVQPAYMITFLNMVVSLTSRFKELILRVEEEKLELVSSIELEAEFNKLKDTYLDKPLLQLSNAISEIKKQSGAIKKANDAIEDQCNKIINSYINNINEKLNKFNINRLVKKLDKINN